MKDRWIHLKTGNIYTVIHFNVIECTNGRENKVYVFYKNRRGDVFCREHDEFIKKFAPIV